MIAPRPLAGLERGGLRVLALAQRVGDEMGGWLQFQPPVSRDACLGVQVRFDSTIDGLAAR